VENTPHDGDVSLVAAVAPRAGEIIKNGMLHFCI